MVHTFRFALIGLLLSVSAGCGGTTKTSDRDVTQILFPKLEEMMAAEGRNRIILVDVRLPAQFAAGHIPGAINIPFTDLKPDHPQLSKKQRLVVYSEDWTDAMSTSAAKRLIAFGYHPERVFDFRGGMDYWEKQGGKIVRD